MNTPIYRLFNNDSFKMLPRCKSNSIDFILTDPPYGIRHPSREGLSFANNASIAWLKSTFREAARILRPGRYLLCFYGAKRAEPFLQAWRWAGLRIQAHFVWAKHYRSSTGRVHRTHECAYLLSKGEARVANSVLRDVRHARYSGNRLHPCQKPTELLKPWIEAYSKPGEIVLDPFMGSGSTGVAAIQGGRRFVGIELHDRYFHLAQRRLMKLRL